MARLKRSLTTRKSASTSKLTEPASRTRREILKKKSTSQRIVGGAIETVPGFDIECGSCGAYNRGGEDLLDNFSITVIGKSKDKALFSICIECRSCGYSLRIE